jgi:hypothetical protein
MLSHPITEQTPTIATVYRYTFQDLHTRFFNKERDILTTKIKVTNKIIYKKNKEGKFSSPDERLDIMSWSAPQYKPYLKKDQKRQMKVKHHYDIILVLQKDDFGEYSFMSKIQWRVGSYKKWDSKPSQAKVKTILGSTKERLKKSCITKGEFDREKYNKKIEQYKKSGRYLDCGDYNSQEKGINGDNYFRNYLVQARFDCLFGPLPDKSLSESIDTNYPFFCKHTLAVIDYLLKRKIIKW